MRSRVSLTHQEAVRLLALADAVEEDGQVVVVVELVDVHLPEGKGTD